MRAIGKAFVFSMTPPPPIAVRPARGRLDGARHISGAQHGGTYPGNEGGLGAAIRGHRDPAAMNQPSFLRAFVGFIASTALLSSAMVLFAAL